MALSCPAPAEHEPQRLVSVLPDPKRTSAVHGGLATAAGNHCPLLRDGEDALGLCWVAPRDAEVEFGRVGALPLGRFLTVGGRKPTKLCARRTGSLRPSSFIRLSFWQVNALTSGERQLVLEWLDRMVASRGSTGPSRTHELDHLLGDSAGRFFRHVVPAALKHAPANIVRDEAHRLDQGSADAGFRAVSQHRHGKLALGPRAAVGKPFRP